MSNVPLLPNGRWLGQDLVWGPWPILAVFSQDLYRDLRRIGRLCDVSRETLQLIGELCGYQEELCPWHAQYSILNYACKSR